MKIENNTLEQVWSNAIQATTGIAGLSYFFQIWIYIYVVQATTGIAGLSYFFQIWIYIYVVHVVCTDLITRQVGICIIIQFPDGFVTCITRSGYKIYSQISFEPDLLNTGE